MNADGLACWIAERTTTLRTNGLEAMARELEAYAHHRRSGVLYPDLKACDCNDGSMSAGCVDCGYRGVVRYWIRFRPVAAWYDIWIGAFIDTKKRAVYVFPLPCLGVRIQF